MTPVVLGLLALMFAGPASILVSRLDGLRKVPRAAMILWQSLALAAVLAGLGASLALAADAALRTNRTPASWAVVGFAVCMTLMVAVRLAWKGHRVGTRIRALRRRHRELVDSLSTDLTGVRVLHHEAAMAYCVPGLRSRVVVSDSTVAMLDDQELEAVLAHERAHLRARHDLVLEAFTVLYEAFPRVGSSASALAEVRLLVEVLADRAAVRRVGRRPLGSALVALAESRTPLAAMGAGGADLLVRMRLLADDGQHRLLAGFTCLAAVLVLAVPTFFVALPWLSALAAQAGR